MKKLLLLNLPFDRPVQRDYGCPHGIKADYYWPPIDLLHLGAAVRGQAELSYLDAVAGRMSRRTVLDAVRMIRPDAIAAILSSITLPSDLSLIAEIRSYLPDVRVWASGDVVFFTDARLPGIDYYVRDLTNSKAIREYWCTDPGSGTIDEDRSDVFSIGLCPHELVVKYPYAMPYSLYRGITSVSTNYGCPFPCTFCNSNKIGFKRRVVDEVIAELLAVQRLGIREVLIRDFTFNMSDADRICDEMIRNHIRLRWSCWSRVDLVDRHILAKMKQAGCYLVSYGVESGDDEVLLRTGKSLTTAKVKEVCALTRSLGIEVLNSFILGLSESDEERTRKLIFAIDPDYLSLNLFAPRLGSTDTIASGREMTSGNTDSLLSEDADRDRLRDRIERMFYLRPQKLLRYLVLSLKSFHRFLVFGRSASALIHRWISRPRVPR